MEAMSNPEEAEKIDRLRKELSASRHLTDVTDDFHLFEQATNKHFNKQMNRDQQLDGMVESTKGLTKKYALKALDDIKAMFNDCTGGLKAHSNARVSSQP